MATIPMIDYALWYADNGFAVFPVKYKGKTPITPDGVKSATTDKETIKKWWAEYPFANIGVATGKRSGGLIVVDLDLDEDRGIYGYDSLRDWERANGELPDTVMSLTGRGGNHLFFRSSKSFKNRAGVLDGVDIRADGGYIVAPPSLHESGHRYEWEQSPNDYDFAEADEVVCKLLAIGTKGTSESFAIGKSIGEGKRNDTLYKLACSLQGKGLDDDSILAAVRVENLKKCNPPLDDEEVELLVNSALTKDKGSFPIIPVERKAPQYITLDIIEGKDGKQKVVQSIENSCRVLREDENLADRIRFNELSYNIHVAGELPWTNGVEYREWTDVDDSNLLSYIEHQYGLKNKDNTLRALDIVSAENKINPIIEQLESLPAWDGKKHIENLMPDYLGVKKCEYTTEAMKLFMLGAISRAYKPGCKFDYMIVLVGEQGIGKSTFLRKLAMSDSWYDDNFNTVEGDKAVERLRGMWFVELAELLAAKRQKEVESIKAFLTSTIDTYRPPYGRRTIQRPRRCVFAGTTNNEHFLTDVTGNRRYLPLRVRKKGVKKSLFENEAEVEREVEQAWAEALHIYKTEKPRLIMPKHLQEEVQKMQEKFLEEDPRIGVIQHWLDSTVENRVCVLQVWEEALRIDKKPERKHTNEIHDIMRNSIVGWTEVGRQRTKNYGHQICYERKKTKGIYETMDEAF